MSVARDFLRLQYCIRMTKQPLFPFRELCGNIGESIFNIILRVFNSSTARLVKPLRTRNALQLPPRLCIVYSATKSAGLPLGEGDEENERYPRRQSNSNPLIFIPHSVGKHGRFYSGANHPRPVTVLGRTA
jgi:hypothetical protein